MVVEKFKVSADPDARVKLPALSVVAPVKASVPPPVTPTFPVTVPARATVRVPVPVLLMLPAVKGMMSVALPEARACSD